MHELQKIKTMLEKARMECKAKDESLERLEENLQNLENKAKAKDQFYKNHWEKLKELEGQIELKSSLQCPSERHRFHILWRRTAPAKCRRKENVDSTNGNGAVSLLLLRQHGVNGGGTGCREEEKSRERAIRRSRIRSDAEVPMESESELEPEECGRSTPPSSCENATANSGVRMETEPTAGSTARLALVGRDRHNQIFPKPGRAFALPGMSEGEATRRASPDRRRSRSLAEETGVKELGFLV
ncbi:hypothetical protein SASPL_143830 [Salvia splendens]|uniref:Uncharacterized protein n=1 Tax=Salvia splendens TaxID=180675 RepID=A0A8X8WMS7_SALSN|nr:hypothetical protein SASPL_143830 [Salvia splendens]